MERPASAAAFLGALSGAGGGLLAIVIGALINAELNRRRDDRLRREEGRSLALSLQGEMLAVGDTFRRFTQLWVTASKAAANYSDQKKELELPTENACSVAIFSKCCDRLGLLEDSDLIANLAQFYPNLPTETKIESFKAESVPGDGRSYIGSADAAIKRSESLAKRLEAVAARLAPPP